MKHNVQFWKNEKQYSTKRCILLYLIFIFKLSCYKMIERVQEQPSSYQPLKKKKNTFACKIFIKNDVAAQHNNIH